MPPRRFSRHTFTEAYLDDVGALVLTEAEPYRYRPLDDNRLHVVKGGETLYTITAKYFNGIPRPAGLWWVLADFQPDPIHDPTIKLKDGTVLVIPSIRTVLENILSESRRGE